MNLLRRFRRPASGLLRTGFGWVWLISMGVCPTASLANPATASPHPAPPATTRKFEVTWSAQLAASNTSGRLFVILNPRLEATEPRLLMGETGLDALPFVARDVQSFSSGDAVDLHREHACFPLASLDHLPPGTYQVQALLTTNRDLRLPNAPGGFVSTPLSVTLGTNPGPPVRLTLDRQLPPETVPADTDSIRYLKIRSRLLSEFHGRPMFLRAAVVLPRSFDTDSSRRYPLLVMIGGFGQRYTSVTNELAPGGRLAPGLRSGPEFLLLQLDGAGPWGDPYQINSANNGPYGDALVQELIPYVEQVFRGSGQPHARLLTGGSTGGWVSLALQIFYPDFFGGCWSGFPDSPDFHAFQLVNLYAETNAYVNPAGFERPSKRQLNGDVGFTMRHEVQLENALGTGDRFTTSGGQWGSWAAVYGPTNHDGTPPPPWDPRTGTIDPSVVQAWQNYDLTRLLDRYWTNLAPRLDGKIHAWVGTADDYFLDGGLHRLADLIAKRQPTMAASFHFEPSVGHGWNPKPFSGLLEEMNASIEAHAPKNAEEAREALMRAKMGHGVACPHCRGGR